MIPYSVYKIIHLVGILMVFLSVGALALIAMQNLGREFKWRKPVMINHGVGLFLSLLGGFGLLARLGMAHDGLPGWILAKLGIWAAFGFLTWFLMRRPQLAKGLWALAIVLGGTAAYLAGSKPF